MRVSFSVVLLGLTVGAAAVHAQQPAPNTAAPAATTTAAAAAAPAPADAAPEPPAIAITFGKRCGGCHTIGEGDRAGPDLLGVTTRRERTWLIPFIRNPGAIIDGGDPVAGALLSKFKGVRMPEQAFTDAELNDLLAYLEGCTAAGGCKITLGKIKHANDATPADIAAGEKLFAGQTRLAGGGPPCISCHHARGAGLLGGGTLAKDLTFVYARLGDNGLSAALASTPFPLMKRIYTGRALLDAEQFQLKAYLAATAKDGSPSGVDRNFVYLGVLGLFTSLGAIGLAWRGRARGVREEGNRGHS